MSGINGVADNNSVLQQLSINNKVEEKKSEATSDQDMFMRLMLAQLENQNPLDPQDGTEFVSQLAQFSSLESLGNINSGIETIGSQYRSSQALQATAMVGRHVLVKSNTGYFDGQTNIAGNVVVGDQNVRDAKVTITDDKGQVVRTEVLGDIAGGDDQPFAWDGRNQDGEVLPEGKYSISVSGRIGSEVEALDMNIYAKVNSVSVINTQGDMMLNLNGVGQLNAAEVKEIR